MKLIDKKIKMSFDYNLLIIFSIILASGTLMVSTDNPIHAILFLILIFFNGSILFFLINFEFFGLIFLIIYVGAIIVLFLFMIMLLNIKQNNSKIAGEFLMIKYYPFIGYFIIIFLSQILIYTREIINPIYFSNYEYIIYNLINIKLIAFDSYQNLINLGKELYSNHIFSFIIIGFLLLIGMIGAIVIAFEEEYTNKKIIMKNQDIIIQAERNIQNSIYFSFKEFFFNNFLEEKNFKIKLLLKK